MFRRTKRLAKGEDKPADEQQIETEAYLAVRNSRKQIARAAEILQAEVRRLDEVLEKRG